MTVNPAAQVIPGDVVTLVIKGRVADPSAANTPDGTVVRVFRPTDGSYRLPSAAPVSAVRVDLVLDGETTVTYEVESKYKNGVWIDGTGRYWMRRPDGWHEMTIASSPVPNYFGPSMAPSGATRLKEDKYSHGVG